MYSRNLSQTRGLSLEGWELEPYRQGVVCRDRPFEELPPCLPGSSAMPITEFLSGHLFDRESERVLGIAFEMACVALRTGDRDVKQAITTKLIALAKTGERNPDILCEEVLKDIHQPQE
jgi:hypothetical protein